MKNIFSVLLIIFVCGCNHLQKHFNLTANNISEKTISDHDVLLQFKNGFWFYKGNLFSGTINRYFESNAIRQRTHYLDGKEDGGQLTYYPGEVISEKRFYAAGEKDSVHTGWWPNGNKRFEYHFAKGIYNGDYKEWYESGKPLKHIHYSNGIDDWGKGWRETGKLYMNFAVKNGRRYGLNNSNLCYTVKNGNGEYVSSDPGN